MSQLITLRQRIKAIETIKKITHAMRLIAMSSITRLKQQLKSIQDYTLLASTLLSKIAPSEQLVHQEINNLTSETGKKLLIIVGSQKGLCGNFNTMLVHFIKNHRNEYPVATTDFIIIGQKIDQLIQASLALPIIYSQKNFSKKEIYSITQTIMQFALEEKTYQEVIILSNKAKSFFIQLPIKRTILPLTSFTSMNQTESQLHEKIIIEETMQELLSPIIRQIIELEIQSILLESLVAEQSARFISMDSATRNAQNLHESTKLAFNKLRQTKITQELTELSVSFSPTIKQ